jgi:GT2 family glycosyltransferase
MSASPGTDGAPLVSVVVVNYNGEEHLTASLQALLESSYPAYELVVVDNASTDGSVALLRRIGERHPRVTVLFNQHNLGYAGGVNSALGLLHGKYLAALNADVRVSENWLEPLVSFLEAHREVGAVSPLILLDDEERINATGQDIHVTGVPFNRCLDMPRQVAGVAPLRVCGLHGSAFVVRRELLDRLGGMDGHGFLYHEDVNLSWALQLMGHDLYCVPTAVVHHDYTLSMHPAKLFLLERNRWRMLLTYLTPLTLLALLPALLVTEALMVAFCVLRGWLHLRAKLGSCYWVLRYGLPHIRERRRFFAPLRAVSEWALLRRLRWGYAWDQLLTVSIERKSSRLRFNMPAVKAFDVHRARQPVTPSDPEAVRQG